MGRVVAVEYVSLDGVVEDRGRQATSPTAAGRCRTGATSSRSCSRAPLRERRAGPRQDDIRGVRRRLAGALGRSVHRPHQRDAEVRRLGDALKPLAWNATLLEGDVAKAVASSKREQSLLLYGSATLVDTLTRHGLIDVYRLILYPLLLGSGQRLFGEPGATAALALDVRQTDTGVVVRIRGARPADPFGGRANPLAAGDRPAVPTVDQSRVQSGFDVEALLGERYLQMLLQTAYDAVMPSSAVLGGTRSTWRSSTRAVSTSRRRRRTARCRRRTPRRSRPRSSSTIRSARTSRCVRSSSRVELPDPFDLFLQLGLATEHAERDAVERWSSPPTWSTSTRPRSRSWRASRTTCRRRRCWRGPGVVDRTIDLGGTSKFKKVEDFFIKWHQADGEHPSALGVYINVRLRNGDEEDMFVPPRGSLDEALNFLPEGEDMAMASRPGLYKDMSKDVFSRTAIRNTAGVMEHALRYNILNPKSKRIGDVDSIEVGRIPPLLSGKRQRCPCRRTASASLDGEYVDPIDLTNTDVTFTIDIRPSVDDDGLLVWNTDLDVSIDALFEFTTFWAFTLVTICFGPVGAAIFLGSVFVLEIGAGIFFGEYFEARASKKADATLSDVIPRSADDQDPPLGPSTRRNTRS